MVGIHGENAARNSKKVILNLEKTLDTEFKEKLSINLIDSHLLVANQEDNFASIDTIIFDPLTGIMEFIKIGACQTFISTKNDIITVESNIMPSGNFDELEIQSITKRLFRGDFIVMVTDGIIEANTEKKEEAIIELLKTVKKVGSQRLADTILQESLDRNFGVAKDDMTVIIVKVI